MPSKQGQWLSSDLNNKLNNEHSRQQPNIQVPGCSNPYNIIPLSNQQSRMELAYLTQLLKSITPQQETISSTFKYCWDNRNSADQVMRIMDKEFMEGKKEKRLAYFQLIDDLLKKSLAASDSNFTKAISMKIKPFITEMSRSLNSAEVHLVTGILADWEEKGILSAGFIGKLRSILCPVKKTCQMIQEEAEPLRYNRNFVIDYMVVNGFDVTKAKYEESKNWSALYSKVCDFNKEYEGSGIASTEQNSDKAVDYLLAKAECCKQELIKFILGSQKHLKLLIEYSEQQLKDASWWDEGGSMGQSIEQSSSSSFYSKQ